MVFNGYRVTSAYGWRTHPISGGKKFHGGIDLVKSHKAPIKAFLPGTVLYAGLGQRGTGVGGYGNVVVVKDSNNRANVYAHLDSVNVKKGQKVTTNAVIGYQGATGQVTGSHLHFEVRKKTSPSLGWTSTQENSTLDPTKYVKGKGGKTVAKLKVDGYMGKATIKRLQEFLGTPQDGKISKPSSMVKELQRFLNKYGQ